MSDPLLRSPDGETAPDRHFIRFAVSESVPPGELWACRSLSHRREQLVDGQTLRITVVTDYVPLAKMIGLSEPPPHA